MIESMIVGHQGSIPIVAQRRQNGGVSLLAGRHLITLNPAELSRVVSFAARKDLPVTLTTPARRGSRVEVE
jgi:hypothetical protein